MSDFLSDIRRDWRAFADDERRTLAWLGGLLALAFLGLNVALFDPAAIARPDPEPAAPNLIAPAPIDTAAGLLDAHNRERAGRRLAPLRYSRALTDAAAAHADHMATVGRMAHFGIGDGTPSDRATAAGYGSSLVGENVAEGWPDELSVMRGWMGSPGHRAAIMSEVYVDMGAALARDRQGRPYWCTVFGKPRGSAALPTLPAYTIFSAGLPAKRTAALPDATPLSTPRTPPERPRTANSRAGSPTANPKAPPCKPTVHVRRSLGPSSGSPSS